MLREASVDLRPSCRELGYFCVECRLLGHQLGELIQDNSFFVLLTEMDQRQPNTSEFNMLVRFLSEGSKRLPVSTTLLTPVDLVPPYA